MFNGLGDIRYHAFLGLVTCGPRDRSIFIYRVFTSAACMGQVFAYRRRERQVFFLFKVIRRCRTFPFNGNFANFFEEGKTFDFCPSAFQIEARNKGACARNTGLGIKIRGLTYFIRRLRFFFNVSVINGCVGLKGRIRYRLMDRFLCNRKLIDRCLAVLFVRFVRDYYAYATNDLVDDRVRAFCI